MGDMSTFDESKHDRDHVGRFAEMSGTESMDVLTMEDDRVAAAVSAMVHRDISRRKHTYRLSDDDVEDARQTVLLDLIAQQKRRGRPFTLEDDGGLIRTVTRSVLSRGLDPSAQNWIDRKAYTQLQGELDGMKASGITITGALMRSTADQVRLSFPAGSRPHADFYESPTTTSLDAPIGEDGDTLGDVLKPTDVVDGGFSGDDSPAARLLSARLHGEVDATEARRGVWDAIAETRDAPRTVLGALPRGASGEYGKTIAAAGGALAAARAWENGDLDEAGERALFAPFGELGNAQMEAVTSTMRSFPDYADEMWKSALTAATALRAGASRL